MKNDPSNSVFWMLAVPVMLIMGMMFFSSEYGSFDYWRDVEDGTSRSEVVRNLGLLAVAVLGVIFAILRWHNLNRQAATAEKQAGTANEQRALAERGHITDRINKAVENLGHQAVEVKLGGIHALWRLIEEIPNRDDAARRRDVEMILDILTSFVRHNEEGRVTEDENGMSVLRIDVETTVRLLGDSNAFYRSIMPENYQLNFREANLSGARLDDCDFQNTNFLAANLSDAVLVSTNFSRAFLAFAKFNRAGMGNAILASANFNRADFTNAGYMTQEQVDSAVWHEDFPPKLPEGLNAPTRKPEEEEE